MSSVADVKQLTAQDTAGKDFQDSARSALVLQKTDS